MKWKTKEGKILNHYDMETSHIRNCIKMLKRNLSETIPPMMFGDQAQADAEREYDKFVEYCDSCIKVFEGELELREKGKPVGEKFPQDVIQPWEIPTAPDHFWK